MTFEPGSNPKFLFGNDLKPINWLVSYKKKKKNQSSTNQYQFTTNSTFGQQNYFLCMGQEYIGIGSGDFQRDHIKKTEIIFGINNRSKSKGKAKPI